MSAVVEEISGTFQGMVKNFGTVIGLVIGVSVFFYMLPVMLQIAGLIKGLTKQGY